MKLRCAISYAEIMEMRFFIGRSYRFFIGWQVFFPKKKDNPASESLVECSGPSALEKLILLIFRISLFGFYSSIIFSVASFKCQTRIQTQVGSLSHWTRIFSSIFMAVVFPIQWMGIRLVHHGLLIRGVFPQQS